MFDLRYLEGVATLKLDERACTGCGVCLIVCPHAVLAILNGKAHVADLDACMECGACANNCPEGALAVQAGVGCASAVISGALRGSEPTCECSKDADCC